jgi:hypothetical protein
MAGYDPQMGSMFEFSADDLEANRGGQLSEMQHYRLRVRRQRTALIGIAVVMVLAFLAALCIYGGRDGSTILTLIGMGITLCSAAITGVLGRYWLRLNADIQGNKVDALNGTLERVLKPVNKRVITYVVRLNGASFTLSKEAFMLFEHEKSYTLYRTPYTGTLVSAERG